MHAEAGLSEVSELASKLNSNIENESAKVKNALSTLTDEGVIADPHLQEPKLHSMAQAVQKFKAQFDKISKLRIELGQEGKTDDLQSLAEKMDTKISEVRGTYLALLKKQQEDEDHQAELQRKMMFRE